MVIFLNLGFFLGLSRLVKTSTMMGFAKKSVLQCRVIIPQRILGRITLKGNMPMELLVLKIVQVGAIIASFGDVLLLSQLHES